MFPGKLLFLDWIQSQLRMKVSRITFDRFLDGRPSYCKSNISRIMEENCCMCLYISLVPNQNSSGICRLMQLTHFLGKWSQREELKTQTGLLIQRLALTFHFLAPKPSTSLRVRGCAEGSFPSWKKGLYRAWLLVSEHWTLRQWSCSRDRFHHKTGARRSNP